MTRKKRNTSLGNARFMEGLNMLVHSYEKERRVCRNEWTVRENRRFAIRARGPELRFTRDRSPNRFRGRGARAYPHHHGGYGEGRQISPTTLFTLLVLMNLVAGCSAPVEPTVVPARPPAKRPSGEGEVGVGTPDAVSSMMRVENDPDGSLQAMLPELVDAGLLANACWNKENSITISQGERLPEDCYPGAVSCSIINTDGSIEIHILDAQRIIEDLTKHSEIIPEELQGVPISALAEMIRKYHLASELYIICTNPDQKEVDFEVFRRAKIGVGLPPDSHLKSVSQYGFEYELQFEEDYVVLAGLEVVLDDFLVQRHFANDPKMSFYSTLVANYYHLNFLNLIDDDGQLMEEIINNKASGDLSGLRTCLKERIRRLIIRQGVNQDDQKTIEEVAEAIAGDFIVSALVVGVNIPDFNYAGEILQKSLKGHGLILKNNETIW